MSGCWWFWVCGDILEAAVQGFKILQVPTKVTFSSREPGYNRDYTRPRPVLLKVRKPIQNAFVLITYLSATRSGQACTKQGLHFPL